MTEQARAEDHLRVIRSLMERATIYRAISAPTALVGGLLSIAAAGASFLWDRGTSSGEVFLAVWLGILALTAAANTLFIWLGAKNRNEPFFSSGMKLAMNAILPSVISAFLFTLVFWREGADFTLPVVWMVFYGLALLATGNFAPRSIAILGWAFLITGLLALCWVNQITAHYSSDVLMALTFGLFHLVYAACTWPRKGS